MPVSAMKAGFQIAECSLSSAKRYKNNFFQKTDRCNYLEYSRDAVLVIYESLLATKKIREIREIRVSPSKKYSRNSLVFTEESRIFAAEKI